ncbi:MAG: hypothetical protein Q8O76_02285, partial [Chloroflexota bacterium]|nr:hypothetical protein [Chloroflexota bacterium]
DGVSTQITLADGRTICGDTVRGVLNRLGSVPTEQLGLANRADREYASQELLALFTSWLYALPGPVLNRPTPLGLAGGWRHSSEWVWLASQAGLPTPRYREDSHGEMDTRPWGMLVPAGTPTQTVIVMERRCMGAAAPPFIIRGCQNLAQLAGTELLGIEFTAGPEGPWTFAGATPSPDLRLGSRALLDVLVSALRS